MPLLAIVSDTHWTRWDESAFEASRLAKRLGQEGFQGIWHAGDVVSDQVLARLREIAPLVCVRGNCDSRLKASLPHTAFQAIEGIKLAMIHGWDLPLGHALSLVNYWKRPVDIIIHGHTHRKRFETIKASWGDCTIINPGSPSQPRGGEAPGFGKLLIESGSFSYERVELD